MMPLPTLLSQCLLYISFLLSTTLCVAQLNGPWNSPLLLATEVAPDVFGEPVIFQDSSGVPCVVRKAGTDTMYCVFQWFREPRNAPTWDRVAVKMSADEVATWTTPIPIAVLGLPTGYQRPFDPTIVCFGDSIRMYFSSSARMPMQGLDSVVNTYSAAGVDGVIYTYEPGIRFDNATRPVIDPAVHYANGNWRFIAPIGAPQEGAYQGISTDGLVFTQMDNIASDNTHNWTGNIMSDETGHMHFYGSGPELWRTPDSVFGRWGTYRTLGLRGGDPSAVQRSDGKRMIVYVGPRYTTSIEDFPEDEAPSKGNPSRSGPLRLPHRVANDGVLVVNTDEANLVCVNTRGQETLLMNRSKNVDISSLAAGIYLLRSLDGVALLTFSIMH